MVIGCKKKIRIAPQWLAAVALKMPSVSFYSAHFSNQIVYN